jgi:hypothetical protein
MVTPKRSMSTEGQTFQVSVLPYRCSMSSFLLCLSCSLRSRFRKFRRDLWITLYYCKVLTIPGPSRVWHSKPHLGMKECSALVIIFFQLRTAAFKAYCAILVRCSKFRHQASPRVSPSESTQRRKVELWARNVREFCLNADFHIIFRHLLHAVKLRHETDGFTSPPKEGVLRIFSP